MTKLINYFLMIVGAWLMISPFLLGYTASSLALCMIVGILVIALAFLSIRSKVAQWPSVLIALLGLFLILWGSFIARLVGATAGASEIIAGILLAVFSILVLPFLLEVEKVQFFNRSGGELATFSKIRMKDNNIIAKGMLLGSMPETIYMYPEEICKALAMIDFGVILALPKILYTGWKRNQVQPKEEKQA